VAAASCNLSWLLNLICELYSTRHNAMVSAHHSLVTSTVERTSACVALFNLDHKLNRTSPQDSVRPIQACSSIHNLCSLPAKACFQ
jgi:hypothetical protein